MRFHLYKIVQNSFHTKNRNKFYYCKDHLILLVNIIQNVGVQFFPLLEYQVFECQTSLDLAIKLEALHRLYCFEAERLISYMHYHLTNGVFYVIEQQSTVLVYAINVVIIICF